MNLSRKTDPNLRAIRTACRRYGAKVIAIEAGGRHHKVTVELADGRHTLLRVARGRIEPFKLYGWVRQHIAQLTRDVTVDGKQSSTKLGD